MSQRNWEFEIALLLFAGFFIAALWVLGGGSITNAIAGASLP